uniref:Uncharacterized protein n=1 Tax=Oryza glumipatula TaxID=40148 RepID=A0A0E0AGM6_9ORYZ
MAVTPIVVVDGGAARRLSSFGNNTDTRRWNSLCMARFTSSIGKEKKARKKMVLAPTRQHYRGRLEPLVELMTMDLSNGDGSGWQWKRAARAWGKARYVVEAPIGEAEEGAGGRVKRHLLRKQQPRHEPVHGEREPWLGDEGGAVEVRVARQAAEDAAQEAARRRVGSSQASGRMTARPTSSSSSRYRSDAFATAGAIGEWSGFHHERRGVEESRVWNVVAALRGCALLPAVDVWPEAVVGGRGGGGRGPGGSGPGLPMFAEARSGRTRAPEHLSRDHRADGGRRPEYGVPQASQMSWLMMTGGGTVAAVALGSCAI